MKIFKRAISVFLAVLMILTSMSAFAVLNDGSDRTLTSRVVFYRMNDDGDWEETVKVLPGDHIQARIILQSDFIAGEHSLYYLFSKDVLELDTDVDPGNGSSLHVCDGVLRSGKIYVTGDASGNADSEMQIMINDGYLDSSVEDNFGGIWLISNGGYSSIFDGVTELYTIDFLVKDDAPEGSVATMFLPTETRRQTRATTPGFSHLYTYSAKVKSADDNNKKLVEIENSGASNPQDWDTDFEVYNLASANINTIGTAQGLTSAEITANTTVNYGTSTFYGTTSTDVSSFIEVGDQVEVRYYVPAYCYDGDTAEQATANWEIPVSSTTGTGTKKKYFYDQTAYDSSMVFTGMTATAPGNYGNLQMIPEGYYFAGWMPVENPDDGFDITTVTAADVSAYNSVTPAISATTAGTSLDYSGLDGKTAAQGGTGDPDEITDMLVADPASATLKAVNDTNFGAYFVDEDGATVLNVVAVVLPVPTEDVTVTVNAITVPTDPSTTIAGTTFDVTPGDTITATDITDALGTTPAEVEGYTLNWYIVNSDGTKTIIDSFPIAINDATEIAGVYDKNTYTVKYMNGETEVDSIDVIFGEDVDVTSETVTAPAGYEVDETNPWLDADNKAPEDYTTMPAKNLVFYAQFNAADQTITYYLDNAATGATSTAKTDAAFTLADLPTKAGYTVTGWTLKDADGNTYTGTVMPAGGLNAYATSTAEAQPITYKVDGTVTALTPDSADTDAAFTLAALPTKAGYTYSAWAMEDGSEIPAQMPAGGITVVTTSTAVDQPITYMADGVVLTDTDYTGKTAKTDATFTLEALPTKAGYTYTAWEVKDADGNAYTGTTMPAGGITVVTTSTALDQDLEYYVDGTLTKTVQVKTDADYTLDAVPTKAGYTYTAWKLADGTDAATTGNMTAGGLKVYTTSTADDQPIIYKVDGVETALTPASAKTDATFTLAALPTKAGYTYTAWTLENGNAVPENMPAGGITVITVGTATEQTITYKVAGEADKVDTYATDATVTAYTPTAPAGYVFDGWYTDDTYTTSATVPTTMGATDIVLYGQFKAADGQTITYMVDGTADHTWTGSTGDTIPAYTPAADSAPTGKEFDGWYTDAACTTAYTGTTMPAGGITVYGQYKYIDYTITYQNEDGSEVETFTEMHFGDEIEVTAKDAAEKSGFTFTGWATADGTYAFDDGEDPAFTMPAKNLVFIAQYGEDVTYTFDTDGGKWSDNTTAAKEVTITCNQTSADALAKVTDEPTKEGYTFTEWALTGTNEYTAQWEYIDYTITYNDWDGSEIEPPFTGMHIGDELEVPADPERAGYTFDNFYTADGKTPDDYAEMPAENLVFTAEYTADPQDITYYVDGVETALTPDSADTDAAYTLAPLPTKAGYTYTAWEVKDADGNAYTDTTMPAGGLNVYTTSTADDQTIIYKVDGTVTALEPATAKTDAAFTLADLPEKAGYTYSAWAMEDGTAIPAQMPAGGITVVTTSTADDQDLEYYVDGTLTKTDKVKTDADYTLDAVPTKAGYTYTAWKLADGTDAATTGKMTAEGLKVYTTSTADEQNLEYYVNGELTKTDKVKTDADYTLDAVPTKAGYTYTAWKLADGTDAATTGKMTAEGLKVYTTSTADMQPITYKVDGTVTALTPNSAATNADVVLAAKPEKDGYTYSDWTLEDGTAVPGKMPVGGITVVSNGTAEDQLVTYVVDGKEAVLTPNTFKTDATITLAAKPEKTGYTYSDWTLEDGSAVPEKMPAGGIKVVSNSTVNKYNVTIKNADNTEISSASLEYNSAVPFPSADAMKVEGQNFIGWTYTDAEGNTQTITAADAATAKVPAYDVVYTAAYGTNTYTVIIKAENLDGTYTEIIDTRSAAAGDTVSATDADKTATGYVLSEDDSTLTGTVAADNSTVLTVVLNRAEYNVYTVVNHIKNSTPVATVKYGAAIAEVAQATKTGYTFDGWYGDEDCTTKFDFTTATMPANDVDLYGEFDAIEYKINFVSEGTTVDTLTGYYEYPLKVTDKVPSKEGNVLTGWATADGKYTIAVDETGAAITPTGYTMPAEDLTFVAQYAVGTYTVNYYVDGSKVASISQEYGSTISYTGIYEAEAGMKLDGWYIDADCTDNSVPTTVPAANVSVYAKTVKDESATRTVTFKDADGNVIGTQDVVIGEEIVPTTAVPEKEGYENGQWSIDGENPINNATMPNEDITLTPIYTAKEYTVTYNNEDGSEIEKFTVVYGEDLEVAADPEKAGYDFTGWTDADSKTPDDYATMPAEDLVFTANFEAADQTITYKVDGKETALTPDTAKTDAGITLAAVPTLEGYTYSAWTLEDGSPVPATMPAGGITVVTTKTANTYTITYNTDGGKAVDDATVTYGDAIPAAATTKDGYSFVEWTYAGNGADYTGKTMPAYDLTATATWSADPQTITYKVDGVETSFTPDTYETDATVTLADLPVKAGYTYTAWTLEDGSPVPATMPAGGITVVTYSTATEQTITYYVDGSVAKTDSYATDATVTAYTPAVKEGYTFDGWYSDEACTEPATVPATMGAKDVTLYGKYDKNVYTVTYMNGTETVEQFDAVEFEAAVPVTATVPTKSGATFTGWTDADNKAPADYTTMPAHSLTFYANFENDVTYTFEANGGTWSDGTTADKTVTVPYDGTLKDAIDKLADEPTTTGADFNEWTLDGENVYAASWAPIDYTITYQNEDGSVVETFENMHYGDEFEVTGNDAAEKPGYEFTNWLDAAGNNADDYTTMPAQDLVFTAQYEALPQPITYIVNGTVTKLEPSTGLTGEAITLAAKPTEEGKIYTDWAMEDGTAIPAVMPYGGITVVSTSSTTNVTYAVDANGGKFSDGTSATTVTVPAGTTATDAIKSIAEEPTRDDGYTFAGWTADETTGTITAQWTAIVKLVAKDASSTAVVERDGVAETYNTEITSATTYTTTSVIAPFYNTYGDYAKGTKDSDTYKAWFITGLKEGMKTKAELDEYVTVTGDGYYEITFRKDGRIGTGSVITVYDKDGNFVEQFYIVVYGDIDGNGVVTLADYNKEETELDVAAWSDPASSEYSPCLVKAADVDQKGTFTLADYNKLEQVLDMTREINQSTGLTAKA